MPQKLIFYLLGLALLISGAPGYAHINATHHMGLVDGLLHLATDVTHVVLLLPAIGLAVFLMLRKRVRVINNKRNVN